VPATFGLHTVSGEIFMSRRLVVAGLAAVFTLPALAQQVQQNQAIPYPVTPAPAETQPNQELGAGAQEREERVRQGGAPQDTQTQARQSQGSTAAQAGAQQSQADRQHIQQVLAASTVSLQQSNFAHAKAQNPRVKQFAEFEIAEQNNLQDVLHSFADPASTASTTRGAQQAASTAPELPADAAAAMERMSRAQGGPAFDRDYVAMQIEGHRKLLDLHERYLKTSPGNREAASIAKLARSQIREHLALLENLRKELGQ
jgi:predicted outer membrane protein